MVSEQQAERSAGQLGVGQKLLNQLLQEDIDELHEIRRDISSGNQGMEILPEPRFYGKMEF